MAMQQRIAMTDAAERKAHIKNRKAREMILAIRMFLSGTRADAGKGALMKRLL
jgi:hypothetical protein